jgi:hypothetical protein
MYISGIRYLPKETLHYMKPYKKWKFFPKRFFYFKFIFIFILYNATQHNYITKLIAPHSLDIGVIINRRLNFFIKFINSNFMKIYFLLLA